MKKYLIIFTERFPECYEGTRQYCKTVDTKAEVKEEIRKLEESPFTVSFTGGTGRTGGNQFQHSEQD